MLNEEQSKIKFILRFKIVSYSWLISSSGKHLKKIKKIVFEYLLLNQSKWKTLESKWLFYILRVNDSEFGDGIKYITKRYIFFKFSNGIIYLINFQELYTRTTYFYTIIMLLKHTTNPNEVLILQSEQKLFNNPLYIALQFVTAKNLTEIEVKNLKSFSYIFSIWRIIYTGVHYFVKNRNIFFWLGEVKHAKCIICKIHIFNDKLILIKYIFDYKISLFHKFVDILQNQCKHNSLDDMTKAMIFNIIYDRDLNNF